MERQMQGQEEEMMLLAGVDVELDLKGPESQVSVDQLLRAFIKRQ